MTDTLRNPAATMPVLIVVLITAEQIKAGNYLLGRYNADTGKLNEVTVIKHRDTSPPANQGTRYHLIGTGADKQPGMPLNEFVDEHYPSWDGVASLHCGFDPVTAGVEKILPAETADAAARTAGT